MTYNEIVDYINKLCKMHKINDSEDIAHDIILELKRKQHLTEDWELPRAKINELHNIFRRKRREYYERINMEITGILDDIELYYEDTNHCEKISIPQKILFKRFLEEKPFRDSLILQRYIEHKMNANEIASDLGLPINTVIDTIKRYEFLRQNAFPTLRKRAKLIRNLIIKEKIRNYSRPFRNKWIRIFRTEGLSDKFLLVRR